MYSHGIPRFHHCSGSELREAKLIFASFVEPETFHLFIISFVHDVSLVHGELGVGVGRIRGITFFHTQVTEESFSYFLEGRTDSTSTRSATE
jgi:hypothetical protein